MCDAVIINYQLFLHDKNLVQKQGKYRKTTILSPLFIFYCTFNHRKFQIKTKIDFLYILIQSFL